VDPQDKIGKTSSALVCRADRDAIDRIGKLSHGDFTIYGSSVLLD